MDGTGNNQLGDLLNGLMSNPEAMNALSGLMKSMSAPQTEASAEMKSEEAEVSSPEPRPQAAQTSAQPTGAFSGINPDMLKMLPNIMSMLGPMINQNKPDAPGSAHNDTSSQKDDAVQTSGIPSGGGYPHHNHRTAEHRNKLLYALKPYLSHSRREAVEQIAKITQITDMLGETGILTSFKGDSSLRGESSPRESHDGKISEPDEEKNPGTDPRAGIIHKT